jgi:hypothetical protein
MRKYFTAMLLASALVGCHDVRDTNPASIQKFDKTVGQKISLDIATDWMERYDKNASGQRSAESSYSITADHLKAIIPYAADAGLAFHHAIDEAGTYHILIIPVTSALLFDAPVLLDANTNTIIDESTARAWTDNYKDANPDQIWYHFFGLDIFSEITQSSFSYFDIEPAINDAGKPQLLLRVWPEGTSNGRTEATSPTVYDFSSPCPPCSN